MAIKTKEVKTVGKTVSLEQKLATIETHIVPIVELVEKLEIVDTKTMAEATVYLSQANKYLAELTKDRKAITKPIKDSIKLIEAKYEPRETMCENIVDNLRSKMSKYQTEATRKLKEDEDKIANRIGDGKGKLTVGTAIKKINDLERPETAVVTADGSVSFKIVKKFEVMDITMLPIEYHIADEIAIREAMKQGVELAGVRYYEEQVPINYR